MCIFNVYLSNIKQKHTFIGVTEKQKSLYTNTMAIFIFKEVNNDKTT